jgi:hypothetical protein
LIGKQCVKDGTLQDARLFGDGYDFQIDTNNNFYLAEVKGIKENKGVMVAIECSQLLISNAYLMPNKRIAVVASLSAELSYINYNYNDIDIFKDGTLQDARLFGDGYDFQIDTNNNFYLAEVKGIKENKGRY